MAVANMVSVKAKVDKRKDALSETVATVSLSTVPRLSLLSGCPVVCSGKADVRGRRVVSPTPDSPCVHAGSNDAAFR